MNAAAFAKMKRGAVLVNSSRGPVIDHDALYEALRSGQLFGAGLDVTEPEPMRADHPLLTLPNCLVVPHIASASEATRDKMAEIAAAQRACGRSRGAPPGAGQPRGLRPRRNGAEYHRPGCVRVSRAARRPGPRQLTSFALALVLIAACLHAFWNLVIARSRDTQAATALALSVGVVAALPFALLRWNVRPEAWPYIAASSALELLYFWLLTTAYRRAELSLIYPIARGTAPVIVLVVSVGLLGVGWSPLQAAGVGLVALGVLLVRGLRGAAPTSDVALALAIAASIASYTLVDKAGVQFADPIAYVTLILVAPCDHQRPCCGASGPGSRSRLRMSRVASKPSISGIWQSRKINV